MVCSARWFCTLADIRKKWLLIAILLFSFYFTYTNFMGLIGEQKIATNITESSMLLERIKNDSLSENVNSSSQLVTLKNPTFEEMKDFLLKDTTSRKIFILNEYECRHFATDVDNNAKAAGWRCGFVLLCYERGQHAVIAFNIIDRGLIFIEPQTDVAINVKVGGTYQDKEIMEILIAW